MLIPVDAGRAYAYAGVLRGTVPIDEREIRTVAGPFQEAYLVIFNPNFVVGPAHVLTAVDYALRAFRLKRNIARSLHVESFLFAAATNDISKALKLFNPNFRGNRHIIVVVSKSRESCLRVANAFAETQGAVYETFQRSKDVAERVTKMLGITEVELSTTYAQDFIEAVEKCLLFRMALNFLSR
ncbi:MAG: KEOPS complex subunit Cgi121 [Thermofilaceae archaeon]|nr:KEOPS complex subunit Cgi121 [Thermofilaceae archaeon]